MNNSVRGFLSVAQLLVGAFLLAVAINQFVFQSYQVYGRSMVPTLEESDRLIISKVGKNWANISGSGFMPERDEIIIFVNPRNDRVQLVKRVIGLPGERVEVKDGLITVFNPDNPEGFDPDTEGGRDLGPTDGNISIEVPEGHLFVSGDNREPNGSLDSRNNLGTVPIENVVGKLVLRIFPVTESRLF